MSGEPINPFNIDPKQYNYVLPKDLIASYPLPKRDHSNLLIYKSSEIFQDTFFNLDSHIPEGSVMVYNNTKVIQARLEFKKETGALIEVFCLEPLKPGDYQLAFSQTQECTWKCMVGNAKKWKSGPLVKTLITEKGSHRLQAEIADRADGGFSIKFSWDGPDLSFGELLDLAGKTPIPPYLDREADNEDRLRYQTVYSTHDGSVAAPTAGLHFSVDLLNKLRDKGILMEEVTLHVGAGTFRPIQSTTIEQHEMHQEYFRVSLATIRKIRENLGRIVAVGTTAVRTLESLYWIGNRIQDRPATHVGQWEPYSDSEQHSPQDALFALEEYLKGNNLIYIEGNTQIMIVPGYRFKVIDGLVTNFHMPSSSLILLVAAFTGQDWRKIYSYALKNRFRFLSYGDSSLLFRP